MKYEVGDRVADPETDVRPEIGWIDDADDLDDTEDSPASRTRRRGPRFSFPAAITSSTERGRRGRPPGDPRVSAIAAVFFGIRAMSLSSPGRIALKKAFWTRPPIT
jgi:hypothetical protein